jgi:hypothetical protein
MMPMQPGKDGQPWELCSPCWREGRKPWKLGRVKITVIEDPHLADALVAHAKRSTTFIDHGTTDEPKAPPKTRSRPKRS